jgi:hypothetical protein
MGAVRVCANTNIIALSPTPALRPKRAIRALVRFDETIGKANGKKDKGKGRQICLFGRSAGITFIL